MTSRDETNPARRRPKTQESARVVLVHWKPGELPPRIEQLAAAGFSVTPLSAPSAAAFREVRKISPAVFVIDLGRLPTHGREVAIALRQGNASRQIPIVFVNGSPAIVKRVRADLPDATYADWKNIRTAIRTAIRKRLVAPVVPGTMDAYSKTPLPKKLGVNGDRAVRLVNAPPGFEQLLGFADGDPRLMRSGRQPADLVVWFIRSAAELTREIDRRKSAIAEGGSIWIAWPKKASGILTDLSERVVRETGLANGLVDYKICAIDDTWSGLKFARRKQ